MARQVENLYCRYCSEEEVYMDVKEEPSSYKIGAQCFDCGHDYGVLDRIPRQEFRHVDDVYEIGEESIRDLLE